MLLPIIILHEAEQDLQHIQKYYSTHYPLANMLLQRELDRVFSQLSAFPKSYQKISKHIHCAPMPRTHQSVYYSVGEGCVEVVAILSQRLNPELIAARLQGG